MAQFELASVDPRHVDSPTGAALTIVAVEPAKRKVDVTVLVVVPRTPDDVISGVDGAADEICGVLGDDDAPFGDEWNMLRDSCFCPHYLHVVATGMLVDCMEDGALQGYKLRQSLIQSLAAPVSSSETLRLELARLRVELAEQREQQQQQQQQQGEEEKTQLHNVAGGANKTCSRDGDNAVTAGQARQRAPREGEDGKLDDPPASPALLRSQTAPSSMP